MPGISSILDIAAQALLAEQLGIQVTGHNIANVNTPGYSRQQVRLVQANAPPSAWGPVGMGVWVDGIEQAFDPLVTARLEEKTSSLSEYEARNHYLEQVASVFNETREGNLHEQLSQFWAAWHDLADDPSGAGQRQALLRQAQSLGDAFSSRAEQLVQTRQNLAQEVRPILEEVNAHTARIAELNRVIQESESDAQKANDLRDQRQQEIHQLAELVGIRYYTSGDGMISVMLNNGTSLVQGVMSHDLDYTISSNDTLTIEWQGPNGVVEDVTADLAGGKLTALVQVRDEFIPQYQEYFDQLAQELIVAVNIQHSQGVGLSLFDAATGVTGTYQVDAPANPLNAATLPFGNRITNGSFQICVDRNGAPLARGTINVTAAMSLNDLVTAINGDPQVGAYVTASVDNNRLKIVANLATDNFGFAQDTSGALMALGVNTFFTGDKAYTLGVNPSVLTKPGFIAAGQIDPTTGAHAPGDNRNALDLAGLENAKVVTIGTEDLTLADAFSRLVSQVGLDTDEADQQTQFYQSMVDQLQQMRDAVSGVSLDEELSNLIKYQRAYQAAARLISVADEMYQTLLAIRR